MTTVGNLSEKRKIDKSDHLYYPMPGIDSLVRLFFSRFQPVAKFDSQIFAGGFQVITWGNFFDGIKFPTLGIMLAGTTILSNWDNVSWARWADHRYQSPCNATSFDFEVWTAIKPLKVELEKNDKEEETDSCARVFRIPMNHFYFK